MTPLFTKLNLKDQSEIVVLTSPASFEAELMKLGSVRIVRDPATVKTVDFAVPCISRR